MRMKFIFITTIFSLAFLSIVGWSVFNSTSMTTTKTSTIDKIVGSNHWVDNAIQKIRAQATNLDAKVLKLGLNAYLKAQALGINKKQILTIVDYTKLSTERRLWVIDLKNLKVLFNTWVSHGKNSGATKATSFSNSPKSLKSSLGVFVTETTYYGRNDYSLRVKGLEPSINDNAYDRSIVFHGASYVNSNTTSGKAGRSWGCFAVSRSVIKPLIDTIKNNTLVIAYYPEQNWLKKSTFIK